MIYFRKNKGIIEKYEMTLNTKLLRELKKEIAIKCGELSIEKDLFMEHRIPCDNHFNHNESHYYTDVRYSKAENAEARRHHDYKYGLDLYNCEYKKYTIPSLVSFIERFVLWQDNEAIETVFNQNFQQFLFFPKVKEKIVSVQNEIAICKEEYESKRKQKAEELQKNYAQINMKTEDIDKHIKELNDWSNKIKKELLSMNKNYVNKMKELNNKLKYLLSIEKLNENQEDLTKYVEKMLSFVEFRLVDTISEEEIERVRSFQSNEIPDKEMKLIR